MSATNPNGGDNDVVSFFKCQSCASFVTSMSHMLKHMKEIHGEESKCGGWSVVKFPLLSIPVEKVLVIQLEEQTNTEVLFTNDPGTYTEDPELETPLLITNVTSIADVQPIPVAVEEPRFKCDICSKGFKHSYNRRRHKIRVHGIMEPTKTIFSPRSCPYPGCSDILSNPTKLWGHLKTHQNRDTHGRNTSAYPCLTCGQPFASFSSLEQHSCERYLKYVAEWIHHICSCGARFRKRSYLRSHQKRRKCKETVNTNSTSIRGRPKRTKVLDATDYRCITCQYRFSNVYGLQRHMKIATCQTKKSVCPNCDKKFQNDAAMFRHVERFHKEKRYHCATCGLGFNQAKRHLTHVELVHGNRQETCPSLDKENKKRFNCATCSIGFNQAKRLLTHIRSEHCNSGKRLDLVRCIICSEVFRDQAMLLWHIKWGHAKEEGIGGHANIEVVKGNSRRVKKEIEERNEIGYHLDGHVDKSEESAIIVHIKEEICMEGDND